MFRLNQMNANQINADAHNCSIRLKERPIKERHLYEAVLIDAVQYFRFNSPDQMNVNKHPRFIHNFYYNYSQNYDFRNSYNTFSG